MSIQHQRHSYKLFQDLLRDLLLQILVLSLIDLLKIKHGITIGKVYKLKEVCYESC